MSSGAGAGNAVLGWVSMRGSSTSMTSSVAPVQPVGQPGGGDRGDRRGVGEHELDPRVGQRRVDRQIRRPGLEHRQDRHDRLGRPGKQQRHTLHPGPHPGRPAGAPTGWRPHRARGRSTSGPRNVTATASGVRATCAANNTGIDTGAAAGWVNTARLPTRPAGRAHRHRADRSTTTAVSGSAVIATNTRCNRSISVSMLAASNTSVSNSTRRPSSWPGSGLHRQRVVVVFAAGELGDGQLVGARQRAGVDRVVLVDEQGVEQLVVAGDAVDLVERQVLVLEGVVVGALQLVEQVGGGGGRGDVRPHRHRVDQQAHHRFRAGHLGRPPRDRGAEGDIVLAGQPHQQLRPGGLQHGVDGGVVRARQLAERPRGLARAPETIRRLARPSPTGPAGRPVWGCRNRRAPRARPPGRHRGLDRPAR